MNTSISGIQMIGIQRSGSNLLRVMLDQSPEIAAPHPPHLLTAFWPLMRLYGIVDPAGPGELSAQSYRTLITDVVAYIRANPVPWEGVSLDEKELLRRSTKFHLLELVRLVYEQAALAKGCRYWCCKSMANVRYAEAMESFGNRPKYIYLYRDGRDVALSFKKAIVGDKHVYHLATQWKEAQRLCLDWRSQADPARFYSLSYEALVAQPEATLHSLCKFLEIPFRTEMLEYSRSSNSRSTAAAGEMWSNLEKPIITNNTNKFLQAMAREELELFELVAAEELRELGYPLYTSGSAETLLSSESLERYEALNLKGKNEILQRARPGDLEKREEQEQILAVIKCRSRVPVSIRLMAAVLDIAVEAGKAVLDVYHSPELYSEVSLKSDASPLTLADKAAHEIIVRGLNALTPDIPVLSEEGADVPYDQRSGWPFFWCVDPLDGTKEFLRRNGEFTINIALVQGQKPIFGVVYVPVTDTLYYGSEEMGSWKECVGQPPARLQCDVDAEEWTAVGSRSHGADGESTWLQNYPVTRQIAAGSALKFCMIAEGKAHIYYREGPTMEWDTAAGHAIVAFSGGRLCTPSLEPFLYNKEVLRNGPFVCSIPPKT
jgi:3'(2'),5'-bisphosphate nucleotidase